MSHTATTTAFGRSLPRELQQERASRLIATGQQALLAKPTQLWKINDEKAGKNGNCQAVYWVKERPASTAQRELKRGAGAAEKQWTTGMVYKGEWKGNLKHGYGIQIWSGGAQKYEGEWADGMRSGHGVLWLREKPASAKKSPEEAKSNTPAAASSSSSSSSAQPKLRRVYAGNWALDQKSGTGVYFYPDGSRYEGNWAADMRSGRGTLYSKDGSVYTGEWLHGQQNGFGTLTKPNKDVYEGEWLNGMREGSGIYYYKAQEKIYDGEWVNDQPKCGVYLDAREFFDDAAEESKYAAALGASRRAADGLDPSLSSPDDLDDQDALSLAACVGDPSLVSPRVPRNRGGMPIPRLRMADADGVLAEAIEAVALERAPIRALPHTSLRELFNETSLDALRRLFASYDSNPATGDGTGTIALQHVPAMLVELTLPQLTSAQLAQLCVDLRKKSVRERIGFQEFVRAVHLQEEAKAHAQQQLASEHE